MSHDKFLTHEDYEYLRLKQISFAEASLGGTKTVRFPGWILQSGKFVTPGENGSKRPIEQTDIFIVIPDQYNDAGLDSFYTTDHLQLAQTNAEPGNTAFPHPLGELKVQFWSRHLQTHKWQPGIDGLESFLPLVMRDLESA